MKKVKLPRKRKKAFIKVHLRQSYWIQCILGEILIEEGRPLANRFYSYAKCSRTIKYPNGYKPIKRW